MELGQDRPPSGSTLTGVVPSGTWRAADGHWVIIGGNGNSVYGRLAEAIGRPDMGLANPRCAPHTLSARLLRRTAPRRAAHVRGAAAALPAAPLLGPAGP